MLFVVDDVTVFFIGEALDDATEQEARNYVDYVKSRVKTDDTLDEIYITASDDGKVDLSYQFQGEKFERIRRITGYLQTLDRWNDAKREEERDRVKHADFDKGADLNVTIASEDNCNKAKVD